MRRFVVPSGPGALRNVDRNDGIHAHWGRPRWESGEFRFANHHRRDGNVRDDSGVCPYGNEAVTATGSGDSASWSGSYVCPTRQIDGCLPLVITYTSFTVALNGATLTLVGSGTGGCDASTGPLTSNFSGTSE